jgi:hypothetical protein
MESDAKVSDEHNLFHLEIQLKLRRIPWISKGVEDGRTTGHLIRNGYKVDSGVANPQGVEARGVGHGRF